MSEPVVEIPARLALVSLKHMHHLSKLVSSPHDKALEKLSDDLAKAVYEQCSLTEINRALVAAQIQMSK